MLAVVHSIALLGLVPQLVRVEVQSDRGPATFDIVGLPETAVRESRVRVRAALAQIGVPLHSHVLTANLAPADLRKIGSVFDLALAVATLAAVGVVDPGALTGIAFLGELSLTGEVRAIRGVLPRLLGAHELGIASVIVPKDNGLEAAVLGQIAASRLRVLVAEDLRSVLEHLQGTGRLPVARPGPEPRPAPTLDLSDVRGQPAARRVLEVAAAGAHDLLMIGPPGAGKTMLARRLPSILPPLTDAESLEVTAVHSVAGLLAEGHGIVRQRPFRAPHHSTTDGGLLGGGDPPRPGELSLAHLGVLFLDELPEFRRPVLEGLRQPLEEGAITISRARVRATFPARPQVVCAMNPCPCGYAGDERRVCRCTPDRVRSYRSRVSGPLADRLDMHVAVPPVTLMHLAEEATGECSASVRERVVEARMGAAERRIDGKLAAKPNARLTMPELARIARPDAAGKALLGTAIDRLGLSARAYGKVLRVARTLADLDGDGGIRARHVAEAIEYRLLDRRIDDAA